MKKEGRKKPVYPEILVGPADAGGFEHLVLDTRRRPTYLAGHIPGALSLPVEGEKIESLWAGIRALLGDDTDREVIVSAGADRPEAGALLLWLLDLAGVRETRFLEGGFEAWARSGGEADRIDRAFTRTGVVPVALDSTRIATRAGVRTSYGREGFEIIDCRDSAAWEAGHIPHALPFDYRSVIRADGSFMKGAEIRALFSRVGPRPSTTIDLNSEFLLYDDGSVAGAALCRLVLRLAGVERVKVFPGGWARWRADRSAPIVRIVGAEEVADRLASEESVPRREMIVLDVRDRWDYDYRHVAGAIGIPSHLFRDSVETIPGRLLPGVSRGRIVLVVYCYGADCIRSRQCSTWAAHAGFRNILWFRGGIREWMDAGGKTEPR